MNMKKSAFRRSFRRFRGQSLAEIALLAPLLILIVTGVVEMGLMFTHYLAGSDATRNSARFSSDSDYFFRDTRQDCSGDTPTGDFYRQTACLAVAELAAESPTISLCLTPASPGPNCAGRDWDLMDDIIISVFSVTREWASGPEIKRFPVTNGLGDPDDPGDMGWSYAVDLNGDPQSDPRDPKAEFADYRMHQSWHTTNDVLTMLDPDVDLNTGFILVEVNYNYYQYLALPWFTAVVKDPTWLKLFSVWPLTSAEPTST